MNKRLIVRTTLKLMLLLVPVFFMQGCGKMKDKFFGGGGKKSEGKSVSKSKGKGKGKKGFKEAPGITNGEITAGGRKSFTQTNPVGMVLIPSGSFIMGQADEDVVSSQINMNKRVTISPFYMDDTEITNNEYRQFVNAMMTDSVSVLGEEFIMTKLYPDTTVWKKDFTHHNGDPMTEYYYSNPAFDLYPVVGVDWDAARYFCDWRSKLLNDHRAKNSNFKYPSFRLPSEAEWEWAARGSKEGAKYPWGNPYVANGKGCFLANFKPYRGNARADGYTYTAPAKSFSPNDYGLYNMSGNVAEWCIDAYSESSIPQTWDLNPKFENDDEDRKIIKGGSWKDVAYYLETGTRTYEFKGVRRSYIGFRCAMDRLGSVPGRE